MFRFIGDCQWRRTIRRGSTRRGVCLQNGFGPRSARMNGRNAALETGSDRGGYRMNFTFAILLVTVVHAQPVWLGTLTRNS